MKLLENKHLPIEPVLELYNDAGWVIYTADPAKLSRALENSLDVMSIWDEEQLIGMIRTVGDGLTIVYVQDILVLKSYKRCGIGRKLMNLVLEKYRLVRQIVLMTDLRPETVGFYENLEFTAAQKFELCTFVKINQ